MTWNYAYTSATWPSIFTILLLISLAVYSWRRRRLPGALPFTAALLFGALWAVGSILEYSAVDAVDQIVWIKFQAVWQLPVSTAVTFFILEYAMPGRWVNRRALLLLSILPLLFVVLIVTNDFHLLVWHSFSYGDPVTPHLGPLGWIGIAYGYGFVIVNLIVFTWLFIRSPQHRGFVMIMLLGQLVFRSSYLLEKTQVLQLDLPSDLFGIAFVYVLYAIALFRFQVLDPVPFARHMAISQMREGLLVLDLEGRVVSLNPAAEQILGVTKRQVKGHSIADLLPVYQSELLDAEETEISLKSGDTQEARHYTLASSCMNDWRGQAVGRLLLLHDVTGQKRVQAQLFEQQRVMAILNERESLARDLHDSIGQTLGYAAFQVDAACEQISKGQGKLAVTQLDRLGNALREAHADVRAHILDLQAAPAPHQPYFAGLRHYLNGFTHNYSVQAVLSVDEKLGNEIFPPDVRMHIFRILQEALSNARKHGQARCIQVAFAMEDHHVRMTIQDDGAGFNPDLFSPAEESHFGLRFMRQRAEALGGCLFVVSQPGQGTQVTLKIPIRRSEDARSFSG
jgi:PAS domain S-box-containing protein